MKIKRLKLYLFSICFIFYSQLFSQFPDWSWAKSASGIGQERGYGIATDQFGNVYVTGNFRSPSILFGNTVLNNVSVEGANDIFISKINQNGDIIWVKHIGGDSFDETLSISTDSIGNILVSGFFRSSTLEFDSFTLTNSGGGLPNYPYSDIFIAKLDSAGNTLWAQSAGNEFGDDVPNDLIIDVDNNIYLTGYFRGSEISFGNTNSLININGNLGYDDFFLAKYSENGIVLWAKNEAGNSSDMGYSLSLDGIGNIYVGGIFSRGEFMLIGTDTLTNAFYNPPITQADIFIAKYDTSGNNIWAKSFGGNGSDVVSSIKTDTQGNIYFTGYFDGPSIVFGTILIQPGGGLDYYLTKMSSNGTVLWAKTAGQSSGGDQGYKVMLDNAENILVMGIYSSSTITFGGQTLNINGGIDGFIVKYDQSGTAIASKTIGGNSSDVTYSAVLDNLDNIYITGYFSSESILFSNILIENTGDYDFFVGKLGNNTIGLDEINTMNGYIFPNPTRSEITINGYSPAYLRLCNTLGQTVAEANNTNKLWLGSLPQGLYLLQLFDENGGLVKTERVVKE